MKQQRRHSRVIVAVLLGALVTVSRVFADDGCTEAATLVRQGVGLSNGSADEEHLYRRAIELCPNMSEARYNLGVALTRQNRRTDAIEAFRKAVELRDDPTFRVALGTTLLEDNALEEAERDALAPPAARGRAPRASKRST